MEDAQTSTYFKLAQGEVSIGNYTEAERYYKLIIEKENHFLAWLALGTTKLLSLLKQFKENMDIEKGLLKYTFHCFQEAKSADSAEIRYIEETVIKFSVDAIGFLYSYAKKQFDNARAYQQKATKYERAIVANFFFQNENLKQPLAQEFKSYKNAEGDCRDNLEAVLEVIPDLQRRTILFIEYASDIKEKFINTTNELETDFEWYILDENEKRRIRNKASTRHNAKENNYKRLEAETSNEKEYKNVTAKAVLILVVVVIIIILLIYW